MYGLMTCEQLKLTILRRVAGRGQGIGIVEVDGESAERVERALIELWRSGHITAWRIPGSFDPQRETFQASGVTPTGSQLLAADAAGQG